MTHSLARLPGLSQIIQEVSKIHISIQVAEKRDDDVYYFTRYYAYLYSVVYSFLGSRSRR